MDRKDFRQPEEQQIARRRRRLVVYTVLAGLLVSAGGAVGVYFAYQPYRAETRFREASNLMNIGDSQAAVDMFNQVLELDPNRKDVFLRRGMAYQNMGKPDLALEDYGRAMMVESDRPAVLTARGMVYRDRGEFQKAVDEFTKALAIREEPDTYFERAQTYALMQEYPKAIADMDKVVAALRDAPHVLRARALLKQKLGNTAGYLEDVAAAESFEKRALNGQAGAKQ